MFLFSLTWPVKASSVAQLVKNLPAMLDTWIQSLGREDPLEKEMATCSVSLPGKSHEQRSLVGCIHGVTKSQARLSDLLLLTLTWPVRDLL